jgi:hypothetical protein
MMEQRATLCLRDRLGHDLPHALAADAEALADLTQANAARALGCSDCSSCCAIVFGSTQRILGRLLASQIAAASWALFLLPSR